MKQAPTKEEHLERWMAIEPNQEILPHMDVIPYKAKGSKYGACGIRIDGNPAFVDAVLSRLKDLMDGENCITRLDTSRRPVEAVEVNDERKTFENKAQQAEVCYIRLCQRGGEGTMAAAYSPKLRKATDRFATAAKL